MKVSVFQVALCVLLCGPGWPAPAQDMTRPTRDPQQPPTSPESTEKGPAGSEAQDSAAAELADEPVIVLHTFANPLKENDKPFYRLSLGQLWSKAISISQDSQHQHQRFMETGQPMLIDQNGIYFWRDFHSYTKGIVLADFFDEKVDVGLYERRFTSTETFFSGRPLLDVGARQPGESFVFSGGRQIFVGVRFDIGKIFGSRR